MEKNEIIYECCSTCSSPIVKAIAWGLPLELCSNGECCSIFGREPILWIYFNFFGPLEGFFSDGFHFVVYEGSYFTGLRLWLFGGSDEC